MTVSPATGLVPIVGIGASAGGVEALEGFFRGLPDQPGLGFVIVTHLSPEHESLLHEIVARHTTLAVHIAADGARVEPNHVHVAPPNAVLGLRHGYLTVRRPDPRRRERKPIDVFFASLAADRAEYAAGVVLSGSDGDGTLGLKAIKEHGGLTLAQVNDGHGPRHPEMPDSAITAGFVDFAVPVKEMGARLVEFAHSLHALENTAPGPEDAPEVDETPTPGAGDISAREAKPTDQRAAFEAARHEICAILRNQLGHDFSGYKTMTFLRRVQRRMQVARIAAVEDYLARLRQDAREATALFRDLLINVTTFFRDADAFEALAREVVAKLFEGRGADATVRVWVPGCATGEEVYSIAILLREHMATLASGVPRVQIFATDIDDRALAVARAARYPAPMLEGVSPERLRRFFVADGAGFLVAKEVRELCIFSPHSVIRDPPFSHIDLVSCRNLLIYFGPDVQNQVIPIFHYALKPGGFLFLGTAENVSGFGELFTPLDKKNRLFRSRRDAHVMPRLPMALGAQRNLPAIPAHRLATAPALRQAVEAEILERYAPQHVVVNRDGDVVHYSGRTGRYLEAAAGAPTRQLLALARRGLRLDLRTVLREAMETGRPATRARVAVEEDDGLAQLVTLTATPLPSGEAEEPLYLVLFVDTAPGDRALPGSVARDEATSVLERELRDTRDRLQSLVEEYETALEELKSSNEELVSVNEELQSTNEELESSKEELQSVNEELQTVNAELMAKVEALDRAHADLQNLFDSTDVATVFLDRALTIRSFTPAVARVFNIRPGDRGRPLTDLSTRLDLPGTGSPFAPSFTSTLAADIAGVLANDRPVERRIENANPEAHYLMRLAPYRDANKRTEGVVVTFVDVTTLSQAEAHQRILIAELQHRTRNLLGMVQAVAQQTLGRGGTLDAFLDRLASLSRVQGLLSQSGESVDLAELVWLELRAHGAEEHAEGADPKITIAGPPVTLTRDRVQAVALAVHELVTNAVKYGALRQETGRLRVGWTVQAAPHGSGEEGNRTLHLDWRESGVALPPAPPPRRGYGRELLERALGYALRAGTRLEFGADGVRCRIDMPLPAPTTEGLATGEATIEDGVGGEMADDATDQMKVQG